MCIGKVSLGEARQSTAAAAAAAARVKHHQGNDIRKRVKFDVVCVREVCAGVYNKNLQGKSKS